MKSRVTVIVPSYNNGIYIRDCIESIINQETDFDYKVIITDDASTDDSPSIIAEYEKKYPNVIVALYSEKNCKLFANVYKALEIMDTEYYCVLDPDDYWVDMKRLQKAIDFLDNNPEYTIYASNIIKKYPDGMEELKYHWGDFDTATSTYEDYLTDQAKLSSTPGSVYRNVCFNNGIPDVFLAVKGTIYEDMFRADAARNLMHIMKGKAYFVNEVDAVIRYYGNGLDSSLTKIERYIQLAFFNVAMYKYCVKDELVFFNKKVHNYYTMALRERYDVLLNGGFPRMRGRWKEYWHEVECWLEENHVQCTEQRFAFSLSTFANIKNRKIVVWGTGSGAEKMLQKYNVLLDEESYFVDGNESKHNTKFMERDVKSPEVLRNEQNFVLIIASSYAKEIIRRIQEERLCSDDNIVNMHDYDAWWC